MALNYFTFGPYDSRDFGIYISGSGTFNAPEAEYETAIVPGRNGALLLPEHRLGNVELKYPAYIYTDFNAKIAAMRSAFLGLEGYQRLTDSYHPDEYRLAYFPGDVEVKTTKRLDAGSFTLTFVCKPQRYLVEGEEAVEIGQWGETTTVQGDVVTFDAPEGTGFKSLVVDIEPTQTGSGTPSPSNVRPITGWSGVNVYVSPTQDAQDATVYPVSFSSAGTVYGGTVDVVSGVLTVTHKAYVITDTSVLTDATSSDPGFRVRFAGHTANDTTTALRPYQLCSHASVVANAGNIGSNKGAGFQVYPSSTYIYFYLGTGYDTLQATKDYCDAQITNGTPVTFLWELATPQTYQLTPAQVEALLGVNYVWADAGDVTLQYGTSPFAMVNPTQQTARPLIRVYGYGTLVVGDCTVTIASHAYTYIDIDCEIMDCHYGTTNCNSLMSFSTHEFPTFPPGVTWISFNNTITKVEVEPDWWRA